MNRGVRGSMVRPIFVLAGVLLFVAMLFGVRLDPARPETGRTLAVGILMAFWWITDAIPLAATALLPMALFPVLGIMKGGTVAPLYLNSILFLFIGGFILAMAMERWSLHRRIALIVILTVGRSPGRLLLGFMLGSWLLSMWVSNTATALMMVPIVLALVLKLEETAGDQLRKLEIGLLLGVAYAASIGGMATLVGTAPNLSFARIYSISFPDAPPVTFVYWLLLGLPVSIVLVGATFLLLKFLYVRDLDIVMEHDVVREEYHALGKPTYEEKIVFFTFMAFALLLITRADITIGGMTIRGWASFFHHGSFIDDGTVALVVALVLFLIPAKAKEEFIMDRGAIEQLPWDIIVLLGGGFALAGGFQDSGLSAYLGGKLAGLRNVHPIVMVLAITTLITFLTELTSNTATTQVVLPVIASLSVVVGVSPLLLMVPATIAASCAFMLPVATPPNAIIFGTHRLSVRDMARTGILLNLIAITTITVILYFTVRLLPK
jgi:sodium-dependent dicarboxylate transporter 2/3/5